MAIQNPPIYKITFLVSNRHLVLGFTIANVDFRVYFLDLSRI